jgi:hypothetical protein
MLYFREMQRFSGATLNPPYCGVPLLPTQLDVRPTLSPIIGPPKKGCQELQTAGAVRSRTDASGRCCGRRGSTSSCIEWRHGPLFTESSQCLR